MYPPPFTYIRAESLEAALNLLAEHGDEAQPLAGGQSLLPFMKLTGMGPSVLVDISRLDGLAGVVEGSDSVRIGALTRHAQVARAEWPARLAVLGDAARVIADVQVRNRGTVGGSLAYADPAGDWAPALLALDARARLRSQQIERLVPLAEFFLGEYQTVIGPGELLTGIEVSSAMPNATGAALKLARRHGDYAVASVAVQVSWGEDGRMERVGIGMGGLAETPVKATAAEDFLGGKTLDLSALEEARDLVMQAANPRSDHRGTAEYRRTMAGVLFKRAMDAAESRHRGEPATAGYL